MATIRPRSIPVSARSCDDTRKMIAGRHRLDFGRPGGHDDLFLGMHVQYAFGSPGDDQRSGVDPDGMLTRPGIERNHSSSRGLRRRCPAGFPHTDHDHMQ
jgi:hypothetical protein